MLGCRTHTRSSTRVIGRPRLELKIVEVANVVGSVTVTPAPGVRLPIYTLPE